MRVTVEKELTDTRLNLQVNRTDMKKFLNQGIKKIIIQHPEIEKILDEYNIGCAPCSVGTCLLKDIVEIHNLSSEEEQEIMTRIAQVFYPDREIKISQVKRKVQTPKEIKYSPPIKKLVDEHVLIKRWATLIPFIIDNLDVNTEEGRQLVLDGVDFIRSYADKYHHAKEEKILFKYFDENVNTIKAMCEDHKKARAHVKNLLDGVERRDRNAVIEHLNGYQEILTEHIKKEDEILYPWIDRNLSTAQVGRLFSKFNDVDEQFGDAPKKYEEFIRKLEEKIKGKKEIKNE